MLSHDDVSPSERRQYHKLGCKIAEFPIDVATAAAAAECEDWIVFGAPNVVRGGSHTGCPSAAEMVRHGLCSVLASDYYYPALLVAPLRLAGSEAVPFEEAWRLVSSHPARAVGLIDRGEIAAGYRADIIIVDSRSPLPEAVLTITGGRIVRCTRPSLLA
jgi:alpha-D-ribose 1-methylphosphonate 5-triphosphate diphosphatase